MPERNAKRPSTVRGSRVVPWEPWTCHNALVAEDVSAATRGAVVGGVGEGVGGGGAAAAVEAEVKRVSTGNDGARDGVTAHALDQRTRVRGAVSNLKRLIRDSSVTDSFCCKVAPRAL